LQARIVAVAAVVPGESCRDQLVIQGVGLTRQVDAAEQPSVAVLALDLDLGGAAEGMEVKDRATWPKAWERSGQSIEARRIRWVFGERPGDRSSPSSVSPSWIATISSHSRPGSSFASK